MHLYLNTAREGSRHFCGRGAAAGRSVISAWADELVIFDYCDLHATKLPPVAVRLSAHRMMMARGVALTSRKVRRDRPNPGLLRCGTVVSAGCNLPLAEPATASV